MQVIFVEGNIGAKKTTFLHAMKKAMPECTIIPEPVPIFFLKQLYKDPSVWAYPFQLIIATERKIVQNQGLEAEKKGGIVFLERSLYADGIFAEAVIQDKEMLEKYHIFKDQILGDVIAKPDLIIYLRSTPEGCLRRIEERMNKDSDRKCESVVSLEYLQKIHDGHEKWLMEDPGFPVLVLDTEMDDWRKPSVASRIADEIMIKGLKKKENDSV